MTCAHCGKEIPENALFCPTCGAVTPSARITPIQTTTYGAYPPGGYRDYQDPLPTYEQEYPDYAAHAAYETRYNQPPLYQGPPNFANHNYAAEREANSGALIAEILCSLFGVYGIGWRMAGKKTLGTVLLVCSFVVIWPLAILIAIATFGLGIPLCDLPLAITGIIINAVLLNNTLNRKAFSPAYPTSPAAPTLPSQSMGRPPQ